MKLKIILFDLDDTLYPEYDYLCSGFQTVAKWSERELKVPAIAGYEKLLELFNNGIRGVTFDKWLEYWGISSKAIVPKLVEIYRQHKPQIAPFAVVPELLARLKEKYSLGILSDGYLNVQRKKLKALKFSSYFDAIVFSDTWGRDAWKPNPKPFQEALKILDSKPSEAIYVADNPEKDFIGAKNAGLKSVRVRYPKGLYNNINPESSNHAPDLEIQSIEFLEKALKSISDL